MILCGWCGHTTPAGKCVYCHRDAETPWRQRAQDVPEVDEGRPPLDETDIRRRYEAARTGLRGEGRVATVEAIAERMDVSPRTLRDYRRRFGLR